jgi:hypothetical protein
MDRFVRPTATAEPQGPLQINEQEHENNYSISDRSIVISDASQHTELTYKMPPWASDLRHIHRSIIRRKFY